MDLTAGSWTNFALIVGGASAALTGLLFVAVSLNDQRIAEHLALRASAGQTLVLFVVPLLSSILLMVPGQPRWLLGTELTVLAVLAGLVLVIVGRNKNFNVDSTDNSATARFLRALDRSSPNLLTVAFLAAGGVTVLAGHGGGLYWLVPSTVVALVGGVMNAWLFLTRLA
jgi:modulator of FtsH protease